MVELGECLYIVVGENDCGVSKPWFCRFPLWKPRWVAINDYSGQVSKLAVRLGNVLGLGPRHAAKTRVCLMYACVCVAKSWRNSDDTRKRGMQAPAA